MKRLVWLGDSLDRVRQFSAGAKRGIGYQLEQKSARTAQPDIEMARRRFRMLIKERKRA